MLAEPVLNKKQNYRLWQGGAFGNKLRAWRTVEEWRVSCFSGKVVLRTLFGMHGPCAYNLEPDCVDGVVRNWRNTLGIPLDTIMVNEAAPDQCVVLQGEYFNGICQDEQGLVLSGYFFYSTFRAHMRDALHAAHESTHGLCVSLMLRRAMTLASYEDWLELINLYPGHVLEVSIYDRCLGDIPGRNALVWEVRKY
jgi:hypothetical protein